MAQKTDTSERYIREWLASQAAAGYISYDATNKKFTLPPENAMVLADENSPVFIMGGYQIIRSLFKNEDKFAEIFKEVKALDGVNTTMTFLKEQHDTNLNLMGKISYAVSSIVCVPNSLADNGPALGAQAGEQKIKNLVYEAGFTRFRRATQTPINAVYEARP